MDRIERGFVNALASMPDLFSIIVIGGDYFDYQDELKEEKNNGYFERMSEEASDS